MSNIAIRVKNLSKRYRIGLKEEMHDTLFGAMADFVRQPIKNLRHLRRLSRFEEDGRDSEDIIWALKDVSFEVERGEVVGIIGRNGAGKTTLLKILSHITEPTSGRAEIKGRVASLLAVGAGFHAELTCLPQAGRARECLLERHHSFDILRTGLGMKRVDVFRAPGAAPTRHLPGRGFRQPCAADRRARRQGDICDLRIYAGRGIV